MGPHISACINAKTESDFVLLTEKGNLLCLAKRQGSQGSLLSLHEMKGNYECKTESFW